MYIRYPNLKFENQFQFRFKVAIFRKMEGFCNFEPLGTLNYYVKSKKYIVIICECQKCLSIFKFWTLIPNMHIAQAHTLPCEFTCRHNVHLRGLFLERKKIEPKLLWMCTWFLNGTRSMIISKLAALLRPPTFKPYLSF